MNRDPLWQSIKDALQRPIDPLMFERCMQDILRDVYPSLVPVVGGSDQGMDGAVASRSAPLPLICTTSEDVLGNFRENITNHIKRRGGPRSCVIATSRSLTPQRRDHIIDCAKDMDVAIIQIHDQEDVIGRLYRDPKWRMELLGISGEPSALSRLPPRVRSVDASLIVGREADLDWLKGQSGDVLVVGQPGSGKTYLHQHLAIKGEAVFAVSDSPGGLADAIRAQAPTIIVVDDAHNRLPLLDLLCRLRHDIGAPYTIHANCWPSFQQTVQQRLGISADETRYLEQLPQKTIRNLIEALGIHGPDSLLHLLIWQSDGRPGLTAALVSACKRGGIDRVWSGEVLADSLLVDRALVHNERDRAILASFAVGGDGGMDAARICDLLDIRALELREVLASLGAGGIVTQLSDDLVSVEPEALRAILVRDVFFRGMARLDYGRFIVHARNRESAAHVLLSAMQRGAAVPRDFVVTFVKSVDSRGLWEHLAWVDENAADVILTDYPQEILAAASGLLHFLPQRTLEALIEAESSGTLPDAMVSEPANILRNWLCPWEHMDETISRRKLLINVLEQMMDCSGQITAAVLINYLAVVIEPSVHGLATRPGEPRQLQMRRGLLELDDLRQLADLWLRVVRLVARIPGNAWAKLLERIGDWAWPGRHAFGDITPETAEFLRAEAKRMLADLLELPACTRAPRAKIAWIVKHASLVLPVQTDPVFDLIFGDRDRDMSWDEARRSLEAQVGELVESWLPLDPAEVLNMLVQLEGDLQDFGGLPADNRPLLYRELAGRCDDPSTWLKHLAEAELPSHLLNPFVVAVRLRQPARWVEDMRYLLARPPYRSDAVDHILEMPDAPGELAATAVAYLGERDVAETRFMAASIPAGTMRLLLAHPNRSVSTAAALAEWECARGGTVRADVLLLWSEAVVRMASPRFPCLEDIFGRYPDLAPRWVSARIQERDRRLWDHVSGFVAAAKVMGKDQRRSLLSSMNSLDSFDSDCFAALLADDVDLYRDWYRQQTSDYLRMKPLWCGPTVRGESLAAIAMDEGASPEEVAEYLACGSRVESWSGSEAAHFRAYLPVYERLLTHRDPRFHVIGRRGIEWATKRIRDAEKQERVEAVRGR